MEPQQHRVIIADDEPPARARLRNLVENLPDWAVVAEAANGREVLEACQRERPDVVLLDIRMPRMDGLETARHLGCMEHAPAVVFTTAYDDYAVKAFDAQALGYLLKPVRRERLQRALEHAAKLTRPQLAALIQKDRNLSARQRLCARVGERLRLIPVDEIFSFQADQKYVRVEHLHGSDLIDEPLHMLEQEFSDLFIRIHRSTLVAVSFLDRIERDSTGHHLAWLRNRTEPLPVARRHVAAVRERLCAMH